MIVLRRHFLLLIFSLLVTYPVCGSRYSKHSSEEYLALGNNALSTDANDKAIDFYEKGIAALEEDGKSSSSSLLTILSLETNLATAYSAIGGKDEKAMEHYEKAIAAYSIDGIEDKSVIEDAKAIVSQTAFFYGMELQDLDASKAVEMYGHAVVLDPNLWAAWANLGASSHGKN